MGDARIGNRVVVAVAAAARVAALVSWCAGVERERSLSENVDLAAKVWHEGEEEEEKVEEGAI